MDKPETKANEEWTTETKAKMDKSEANEEWTSQRQRQMKNGQARDKGK